MYVLALPIKTAALAMFEIQSTLYPGTLPAHYVYNSRVPENVALLWPPATDKTDTLFINMMINVASRFDHV